MESKKKNNACSILRIAAALLVLAAAAGAAYSAELNEYYSLSVNLLNQDPDPAKPGEYVELRWKVEKSGNDVMRDLRFSLEQKYPFSFDPGDDGTRDIGDWLGFTDDKNYYTLYYKIRVDEDALEGDYDLKLWATYGDDTKTLIDEYTIRVGDKERPKLALGSMTTSPTKLVADTDEAKIEIDIENTGDADAENLKATIELPEGFSPSYSYADRAVLGTISAGSSKTARFYADIGEDLKGGVYDAKLRLEYIEEDDGDNEVKSAIIPIELPIMDRPQFDITSVSTAPEKPMQGDDVTISVTVKNTGGEDAESVSIRIFKESSQPFEFDEKSDFIGKLRPGEEGEAVIKLAVDKDANPKTYIMDAEIRSIYNEEVLLQEKTISMEVYNGEEKSAATGMFIAAFVAALCIGLFFLVRKLRR